MYFGGRSLTTLTRMVCFDEYGASSYISRGRVHKVLSILVMDVGAQTVKYTFLHGMFSPAREHLAVLYSTSTASENGPCVSLGTSPIM